METLKTLDLNIFFWINGHHTPFLDKAMFAMTHISFWLPLLLLAVYFLFRRYHKKTWTILLFFVLNAALTDRSSVMIKNWVQRPRPTRDLILQDKVHVYVHANGKEYRGGHYSFPSSHAANSFGMVALFIFFLKPVTRHVWWIFPLWALIFCYTRMYLGVHYPTDICCGTLLGLLCGLLTIGLYRLWDSRHAKENQNIIT